MLRLMSVALICFMAVVMFSCGGGGGADPTPPTVAPRVTGEVTNSHGTSATVSQDDPLFVRIVVVNNNPDGTDVDTIRYCVKHDPDENSPLTETEAGSYLDPVPTSLPANIDVASVPYTGTPQVIEINSFKGQALTPNDRYWLSAVFVAADGKAGPVTPPQRFKLIFKYKLVDPPKIGILKDFQGTVKDHEGNKLPNAFVQFWHKDVFLEACVTEDDGTYYMEVLVPGPTASSSALKDVSCEETDDETDYDLKVYHPYYSQELDKNLIEEYVHFYVDFQFPSELHNQGSGI